MSPILTMNIIICVLLCSSPASSMAPGIDAEIILPDYIPPGEWLPPVITMEPAPTPANDPALLAAPYTYLWYNVTDITNVKDFLERCPTYEGKGQCVAQSRYRAFEARKHNLSLYTCIVGGSGGAQCTEKHQVNTFRSDGVRYYTSNLNSSDDMVCTGAELIKVLNGKFTEEIAYLNPRDYWMPCE